MTPEAAKLLEERLTQEQLSVAPVGAVSQALMRPDILLLAAQYFLWSLGVYGFVLWLPTILRQGGSLSMANTGLFSACPYILAVVMILIVSTISDKTQKRLSLIWPLLLVSALALFGSFLFAQRSFAVAFGCLIVGGACMYAPYGPYFAMMPERVPRNVVAEVIAFINSSGALGGFFGAYFVGWLQATTGNSRAGYLLMSLSLLGSSLLLLFLKEPKKPETAILPEAYAK